VINSVLFLKMFFSVSSRILVVFSKKFNFGFLFDFANANDIPNLVQYKLS